MMNRQPQNYGAISPVDNVDFTGNRSMEFNNFCDNVVTNIYTINSGWKTLDGAFKKIATWRDTEVLRNKIHITNLSTNQIISATSKDIAKLKLLQVKGNKQQQLQVEKLEENFKEAVNNYCTLQKKVANKQKEFWEIYYKCEGESPPQDNLSTEVQAQLAREMAFEQDMMLDREARVKRIEADVLDVNQIMRDLGTMVHDQGETLDTIENNIDHAVGNVEEGNEQLIKASQYQNKYRKKLIILALVGFLIAVILIIILVVELKKK